MQSVKVATNLAEAWTVLSTTTVNAICIDLLSVGLDEGSAFVCRVRETWPEIVFVLYINKATAERQRSTFYKGERSRFSHYDTLDKQTPVAMFADEVGAMVATCQNYLSFSTSAAGLAQLRQEAQQLRHQELSQQEASIVEQLQALMAKMSGELERRTEPRLQRKVLLSHRFAEKEYVDGLCRLLEEAGFEVITGRSANTYISKAIIERIHNCDFFLLLVTKGEQKADGTYTTSSWLLEEKGVALAFGQKIVIMVEEGVTDIGGLQGDWQRIHFGPKGFLSAALEAVAQRKSYLGDE